MTFMDYKYFDFAPARPKAAHLGRRRGEKQELLWFKNIIPGNEINSGNQIARSRQINGLQIFTRFHT